MKLKSIGVDSLMSLLMMHVMTRAGAERATFGLYDSIGGSK